MEKIELGTTGAFVSCIGLGTMYFGTRVGEKESFRIMDHYVERGGNFLDSANKYASWEPGFVGGESELTIGRWLKQNNNRKEVFLTSKLGFPYGDIPRSLRKETIVSECEKSLKRMGIEVIDLYFAHTFDTDTPVEESMEAFYLLKKQGKIRYAGASNHYAWQLVEANMVANRDGWEGFCCIQQRHTYLEPSLRSNFGNQLLYTPELKFLCQEKGITPMAYSPLLGGAYVRDDRPFPVHYESVTNDFRLQQLQRLSAELNVSPNAMVLAWMLHDTPRVMPIVAASGVPQLQENLEALTVSLTGEQFNELTKDVVQPQKYS